MKGRRRWRFAVDSTNRDTEGWVQSGLRGMSRDRSPGLDCSIEAEDENGKVT